MTRGTYLEIDLATISENSRRVVDACAARNIEVLGVTKGFSAIPEIVRAMTDGGIEKLADARMENVMALRRLGFRQHMTLLRIPMLSRVGQVVAYTDCSLNSELAVIKGLSDAALMAGKTHDIVLMIDVGDLREGVLPDEAADLMRRVLGMRGVHVCGVGTNMGCYGGILPTQRNLSLLGETAKQLEHIAGCEFEAVSGGGTSSLALVADGSMPPDVNQLRIGEGILLGTDTTHNSAIPWLRQDAFLLRSEIVEVKKKPSLPYGETGLDAFGNAPKFVDNGVRKRAIVALGRQDVPIEGILPLDPGIAVLGASSDHMILDVTDARDDLAVGDQISFRLNYQGLLHLCSSKYVRKVYRYPRAAAVPEAGAM